MFLIHVLHFHHQQHLHLPVFRPPQFTTIKHCTTAPMSPAMHGDWFIEEIFTEALLIRSNPLIGSTPYTSLHFRDVVSVLLPSSLSPTGRF
ncbi:hypothetical protein L1987_00355 [Smallanthus sonchifolius]|uniref:Uncharacterized protein n=1 Tax=Smallanthus sonchifolius TaxID=185202 RepID=A0ACB9K298_9ASTR|nr:hypothetical protein L1987_00355 [Smallanthus sonchifolius]